MSLKNTLKYHQNSRSLNFKWNFFRSTPSPCKGAFLVGCPQERSLEIVEGRGLSQIFGIDGGANRFFENLILSSALKGPVKRRDNAPLVITFIS